MHRPQVDRVTTQPLELARRPGDATEYRALALQSAGVGELDVNVDTATLWVSPGAATLCGLPPQALLLSRGDFLQRVHGEERAALATAFDTQEEHRQIELRFRVMLPEGGHRWLIARLRALQVDGEAHLLGALQNIQREVELEDEAAQSRAELARQRDELQAQGEQLQSISTRVLAAQEEERRRISRELHDEIGQTLTACILNLELEGNNENAALNEVIVDLRRVLSQIREMSLELRPPMLDRAGLKPALGWLVDRVGSAGRLRCKLQADGLESRLDPRVEITAFRLVQEALTNITRHARAKRVDISIARTAVELAIRISDDGVGFEVTDKQAAAGAGTSQGVLGMAERAQLIGGRCEIVSLSGVGSMVLARLPLHPSP